MICQFFIDMHSFFVLVPGTTSPDRYLCCKFLKHFNHTHIISFNKKMRYVLGFSTHFLFDLPIFWSDWLTRPLRKRFPVILTNWKLIRPLLQSKFAVCSRLSRHNTASLPLSSVVPKIDLLFCANSQQIFSCAQTS